MWTEVDTVRGKEKVLKYYFIVNPGSRTGGSSQLWKKLLDRLEKSGRDYEVYYTGDSSDAKKAAQQICAEDTSMKRIVVVGGDGTLDEVVNGLPMNGKYILGVIPTGSSNDYARGMSISLEPETAFDHVMNPRRFVKVDRGSVLLDDKDTVKFAVSSGFGYDAQICYCALTSGLKKFLNRFHMGKLVYYLIGLRLIASCRRTKATVIIDGKHRIKCDKLVFAAVMNTRYEGGGMPMGPDADPTDGKLTVCLVHDISRLRHLSYMPTVIKGNHIRKKGVEEITCTTCEIITDEPMYVHTDGEYAGRRKHALFSCDPGKMKLML